MTFEYWVSFLWQRYFSDVLDSDSNEILSIASYNAGVGTIKQKLNQYLNSYRNITPQESVKFIMNHAPSETRRYLKKVLRYKGLIGYELVGYKCFSEAFIKWLKIIVRTIDEIVKPKPKINLDEIEFVPDNI